MLSFSLVPATRFVNLQGQEGGYYLENSIDLDLGFR